MQYSFKTSSLIHKLTVSVLVLIVIAVALLGYYLTNETSVVSSQIEEASKAGMVQCYNVTNIISRAKFTVNEMSAVISEFFSQDCVNEADKLKNFISKIDDITKATIEYKPHFQGAWFQTNPAIALLSSSYLSWHFRGETQEVKKFENTSARPMTPESDPYFYNAIKANKAVLSAVYKDVDLQLDMITISEPVYKNGVLIGVSGIDFSIEDINSIFSEAKTKQKNIDLYLYDYQKNLITGTKIPNAMLKDRISKCLNDGNADKSDYFNESLIFKVPLVGESYFLIMEIPAPFIFSGIKQVFLITFSLIGLLIIMLIIVLIDKYKLFNYAKKLMEARKKAEALTSVKANFLRNMGHEILTPINGITGFLELLGDTNLSAEQSEFIKEAKMSSDILLNLVREILEFSKIQDGQIAVNNSKMDIRAIVGDIVSSNVSNAEQKKIAFNTLLRTNVPDFVLGDRLLTKQILNIFIGNAIKFTNNYGEVLLDIDSNDIGEKELELNFTVTDTGCGISDVEIKKINEAFEKADLETTKSYGGIGLGLAIANRLVKIMGASIKIKSELSKGTVFAFSLKSERIPENKILPEESILKKMKILVIENNKSTADVLKYYLESCGCKTQHASSAKEGINLFKENNDFGAVITESNLEENSWLDVSNALNSPKAIPTVVLCDSYKRSEAVLAQSKDFFEVLKKPFLQKDVAEALKKALSKNQSNAPANKALIPSTAPEKPFAILLVEDTETHRKIILKTLDNIGIPATDVAYDGYQAIKLCEKNAYDLIIMDCQLPEMDGFETTRRIRNLEIKNQHTIIMGMTAYSLSGEHEKCISSGMDEFISKPFEASELIEKLSTMEMFEKGEFFRNMAFHKKAQNIAEISGLKTEDAIKILNQYKTALPNHIIDISTAIQKRNFNAIHIPANSIGELGPFLGIEKLLKLIEALQGAAEAQDAELCTMRLEEIRNCVKLFL